jgi:hypothetical protein
MATRQVFGQPAGAVDAAVAAHAAASDPHPTYLTAAEGNAAYSVLGHTHAGGSTVKGVAPVYVTSGSAGGNTNPDTSGAWAQLTGVGELVVPAAVGDLVECTASFLTQGAGNNFHDLAVKVGGSLVWFASSGTGTAATEGDPALYPALEPHGSGFAALVVAAPHLDSAAVHFVLAFKGSASGKTYYSSAYPFRWMGVNYGPP